MRNFKPLAILLAIILIIPITTMASGVQIWINGDYVQSDVAPVLENGRTLVPVRVISENLGYEVDWDQAQQKVTIEQGSQEVILHIGQSNAVVNGNNAPIDSANPSVAPKLISGRTMVPLRFIAESFGVEVDWDGPNRTAVVGEGYTPPETPPAPTPTAGSGGSGTVTVSNQSGAKVVTVDLADNLDIKVVKPGGKRAGVAGFGDYIGPKTLAAVNGNFFDSYTGANIPYGTQMANGKMANLEGKGGTLLVFDNNKVKILNAELKYRVCVDGKTKNEWNQANQSMDINIADAWYVNTEPNDTSGIYIFNDMRNTPTNLNGGIAMEVVNGVFTKEYEPNGNINIPANGYVVYFGRDSDLNSGRRFFKQGSKVDLRLFYGSNEAPQFDFDYKGERIPLSKVTQIVQAEPMLVENGQNVAAANAAHMERKISSIAAQRSCIGITADDKLIIATMSGTVNHCADVMIQLGCVDAFNLDGGASSALYANGQTLQAAGRSLNTVLTINSK